MEEPLRDSSVLERKYFFSVLWCVSHQQKKATKNQENVCNLCKNSHLRPRKTTRLFNGIICTWLSRQPNERRSWDWQHHLGVKTEWSGEGEGEQYSKRRTDHKKPKSGNPPEAQQAAVKTVKRSKARRWISQSLIHQDGLCPSAAEVSVKKPLISSVDSQL